jgi:O-antigen ligase
MITSLFIVGVAASLAKYREPVTVVYGEFGRNFGLLTYFLLAILTFAAYRKYNKKILSIFIFGNLALGAMETIYAILQNSGIDFGDWTRKESFGTFGNTNFLSAYLGIVSIVALIIVPKFKSVISKTLLVSLAIFLLIGVKITDSVQGFFCFAVGFFAQVFLFSLDRVKRDSVRRLLFSTTVVTTPLIAVISLLGFAGKGILSNWLSQETMQIRYDYWVAGLKMFEKNPIGGVGFDEYGSWYRFFRSEEAISRTNANVITNSSHNVYIDYLANNGIFFFVSLLLLDLLILLLYLSKRYHRQQTDSHLNALFVIFIAGTAQSLVSINNLGLTPMLWICKGFLLGALIKTVNATEEVLKNEKGLKSVKNQKPSISKTRIPMLLVCSLIGAALVWPLAQVDSKLKGGINSGDEVRLNQVLASPFALPEHRKFAINALIQLGEDENTIKREIASTLEKHPREFELWALVANSSVYDDSERREALARLKELDPRNPLIP